MEILRIVLKNGEVKTFPWNDINFEYDQNGKLDVWKPKEKYGFLFCANVENVEYAEKVEDT